MPAFGVAVMLIVLCNTDTFQSVPKSYLGSIQRERYLLSTVNSIPVVILGSTVPFKHYCIFNFRVGGAEALQIEN